MLSVCLITRVDQVVGKVLYNRRSLWSLSGRGVLRNQDGLLGLHQYAPISLKDKKVSNASLFAVADICTYPLLAIHTTRVRLKSEKLLPSKTDTVCLRLLWVIECVDCSFLLICG